MNNPERFTQLLNSLGVEISNAKAGTDLGQFPILDLVGNLRDTVEGDSAQASLHKILAEGWEKVVRIVESGKPFTTEDVAWLNLLFGQVQLMAGGAAQPAAAPAPAAPPAAAPVPAPVPVVAAAPAPAAKPTAPSALPEEQSLTLNIESDGDLLREFINESREHLDNIEQGVLVLENKPDDAETLNTIFRAFHTFKGGAGFLNLMPINRLAHVLESLLDLARQGKLIIDAPVIEIILSGRDRLKKFLDAIDGQTSGSKPAAPIVIPTEQLKADVTLMIDQVNSGVKPTAAPAPAKVEAPAPAPVKAEAPAPIAAPVAAKPEPFVMEAPVAVVAPTAPAAPAAPVAAAVPTPESDAARQANAVVKVDTNKLDGLLDLVGEMVIAQSLVAQNLSQIPEVGVQFTRNMAQLSRITRELQRVSMSLRMMPIRGVFQKMARVARDVSSKQQKKVNFLTSGEDTELDRGVVEELNDPLLHMIRNSVDHGIESPEKRIAAGKPETGSLNLRAYHQGGNIVVEIEDDGGGLNRDRILAKAVERGLAAPNANLSDAEVFNFIFAAGFSTAEKVTDLSGRGVGLDVVRRNIERLRGRVDISSTLGKGTLFKITLPLTLAIIDGLIVKVGQERYILPTLSVRESFRPTADMITRVKNQAEVVNVRGRLIPLVRLHEIFNVTPLSIDPTESLIVVVQCGSTLRCLLVDTLLHKQEVVIKNINDMMVHKNRALAGATILGDGRVGLILDVNNLTHADEQTYATAA